MMSEAKIMVLVDEESGRTMLTYEAEPGTLAHKVAMYLDATTPSQLADRLNLDKVGDAKKVLFLSPRDYWTVVTSLKTDTLLDAKAYEVFMHQDAEDRGSDYYLNLLGLK